MGKKLSERKKYFPTIHEVSAYKEFQLKGRAIARKVLSSKKYLERPEVQKRLKSNAEKSALTKRKNNKLLNEPVFQLDRNGKIIKVWGSIYEAQDLGKFNAYYILDNIKGNRKSHKRFRWSFYVLSSTTSALRT